MAADVVSAELAVRLFPTAKRFGRRWQAGVDAEGMHETIRGQRAQELTIGLHGGLAWTVSQTDLLEREGQHLPFNFLATERLAVLGRRIIDGILRRNSARNSWQKCRADCGRRGCEKIPAGPSWKLRHDFLLQSVAAELQIANPLRPGSQPNNAVVREVSGCNKQGHRDYQGKSPDTGANSVHRTAPHREDANHRRQREERSGYKNSRRPDCEVAHAFDEIVATHDNDGDNGNETQHSNQRPQTHPALSGSPPPFADAAEDPERRVDHDAQHGESNVGGGENLRDREPRRNLLHHATNACLHEPTIRIGSQQYKRRHGIRRILLRYMTELPSRDRDKGVIPVAEVCHEQFAVVEVNPAQAGQTIDEGRHLHARRVRNVPSSIVSDIGWQRSWSRNSWFHQIPCDVGTDSLADFFKGVTVPAIDAEEISDVLVGHVGHIGQSTFDASVVAVINEALLDAPVIAEAVCRFQAVLRGPGAGGDFHAIDV